MGSRVRIRLLHILHFVMMDFLLPLLKNSKSGVDDRGHRFGSGSPLTNYPHESPVTNYPCASSSPLGCDFVTSLMILKNYRQYTERRSAY